MAKRTKITAASIAKAMQLMDEETTVITCGTRDNAIEIPVKRYLSMSERAALVNDVVNMVFIASGNEITYCPAFKSFAIEYNIVTRFAEVALPIDSNKANKFLEQSGLFDKIAQAIQAEYLINILNDIDEAIEYRKQELLKKNKFGSIIRDISSVIKLLGDKIEDIDLPQIMEIVEENAPEFKDEIRQLVEAEIVGRDEDVA